MPAARDRVATGKGVTAMNAGSDVLGGVVAGRGRCVTGCSGRSASCCTTGLATFCFDMLTTACLLRVCVPSTCSTDSFAAPTHVCYRCCLMRRFSSVNSCTALHTHADQHKHLPGSTGTHTHTHEHTLCLPDHTQCQPGTALLLCRLSAAQCPVPVWGYQFFSSSSAICTAFRAAPAHTYTHAAVYSHAQWASTCTPSMQPY